MSVNCVFQGTLVDPLESRMLPTWLSERLTGEYEAVSFCSIEAAREAFERAAERAFSLSVNAQVQTLPGPRSKVLQQFLCHSGKLYILPDDQEAFPLKSLHVASVSELLEKMNGEQEETFPVDLEKVDLIEDYE